MNVERLKYATAVVLYGTIAVCLRYVSLPSEIAALCRGVIGSLFLLAFLTVRRQKPQRDAIRANLFWLILSGVCLGLNWIFLFAAYTHTTVAIASLCNYMAPLIVILVAPLLLREPLEKRKLPVQTVAVLGYLEPVVSVLCSALLLDEPLSAAGWVGAVLIIAAAVASELIPSGRKEKSEVFCRLLFSIPQNP